MQEADIGMIKLQAGLGKIIQKTPSQKQPEQDILEIWLR
jgi:hypothetical protein